MIYKKLLCGISMLTICFMLTGCCMSHEWKAATCTEPKTCAKCGKTEGEPLGHTLTKANYQQPATCEVCGETVGEPLTASFEEHGLNINVKEGITYDYVTSCADDTSFKTVGHLTVSDYRILKKDATHEAKEGYEWRACHVSILFDDENASDYGTGVAKNCSDYYATEDWENNATGNGNAYKSAVNYKGTEYTECIVRYENEGYSGWVDNTITYSCDFYVQVPIGYDGIVLDFYDRATVIENGMHIYDVADENTLFFRMD